MENYRKWQWPINLFGWKSEIKKPCTRSLSTGSLEVFFRVRYISSGKMLLSVPLGYGIPIMWEMVGAICGVPVL